MTTEQFSCPDCGCFLNSVDGGPAICTCNGAFKYPPVPEEATEPEEAPVPEEATEPEEAPEPEEATEPEPSPRRSGGRKATSAGKRGGAA